MTSNNTTNGAKTMTAKQQIAAAAEFGRTAFENGIEFCSPQLDSRVIDLIKGRNWGETPRGEASSERILKQWHRSYTIAMLDAPLE